MIKAARAFRMQYDNRTAQILQQHQAIETSRQQQTLRAMRTFLQLQEGMMISMQKNIHSMMSMLDETQPEQDLQEFIAQRASGISPPALPAYRRYQHANGGQPTTDRTPTQSPEPLSPTSMSAAAHEEKSDELLAAEAVFRRHLDDLFWSSRKEGQDDMVRRAAAVSSTAELSPAGNIEQPSHAHTAHTPTAARDDSLTSAVLARSASAAGSASPSSSASASPATLPNAGLAAFAIPPPITIPHPVPDVKGGPGPVSDLAPWVNFDVPPASLAPPSDPYELTATTLDEMEALLRTRDGRVAFATVLNQHRSLSTGLPSRAFDTLGT
jgi:hypothetical protein